ncbi:hypothetical protein [Raoultella ornithinolytica]|uniref:hypothetical protein n=1 Tax=Raoultella ornithinolytica TaxID=54291 RepID=UPI00139930F4|nr:hypothetical protein [Raoultella ornithinolytica]QHW71133.1 hypothetical protein GZS10_26450 [Raoultella ornithinolytica]
MKIRIEYLEESGRVAVDVIAWRWRDDEIMSWVGSIKSRIFKDDKEISVKVSTRALQTIVRIEGYPGQAWFQPARDRHI